MCLVSLFSGLDLFVLVGVFGCLCSLVIWVVCGFYGSCVMFGCEF